MIKNIIIIRPDHLGDLVLSMPVIEETQVQFPNSTITVLINRDFTALIQERFRGIRILSFSEKELSFFGRQGFFQTILKLKQHKFDFALTLQDNPRLSFALALAGIPLRAGPLSKLYSRFYFTHSLRQSRSRVEKHELEYNLDLLRFSIPTKVVKKRLPSFDVPNWALKAANLWLKKEGIDPCSKPFFLIHPGMAGSALNWPLKLYLELISFLQKKGYCVLLSFGPKDQELLTQVKAQLMPLTKDPSLLAIHHSQSEPTELGQKSGNDLIFFAALIRLARAVLAPSTGPLHLAACVGTPLVGLYSPLLVQSKKRWGPQVERQSQLRVLSPKVKCPEIFRCAGLVCQHYPCMQSITVDQVFEALREVGSFG